MWWSWHDTWSITLLQSLQSIFYQLAGVAAANCSSRRPVSSFMSLSFVLCRLLACTSNMLPSLKPCRSLPSSYLYPLVQNMPTSRSIIFYDQIGCGQSSQPEDERLWVPFMYTLMYLFPYVHALLIIKTHSFHNQLQILYWECCGWP